METEQYLLEKMKELKKTEQELLDKMKLIKEGNPNKQREFITSKFREFMNMELTEEYIWAFIFSYRLSHCNFYTKPKDENMLLERKLINFFALQEGIRYEDSLAVLQNFLYKLQPINLSPKNSILNPKDFVPLFC